VPRAPCRRSGRCDAGDLGKPLRQIAGRSLTMPRLRLQVLEAQGQQGREILAGPEVPAEPRVFPATASRQPPDVHERLHASIHLGIISRHRPAFAGGQVLAGLKAERPGVADGSGHVAVAFGSVRLGAVLDDRQAMPVCNRHQRRHVRRMAGQVYRQNRFRPARHDGCLDRLGVDGESREVDIHERQRAAAIERRAGRGDEGVIRQNDFAPVATAVEVQCCGDRGGDGISPVADEPGVLRAAVFGETLAEHLGPRPRQTFDARQVDRAQCRLNPLSPFLLGNDRPGGPGLAFDIAHGRAALGRQFVCARHKKSSRWQGGALYKRFVPFHRFDHTVSCPGAEAMSRKRLST